MALDQNGNFLKATVELNPADVFHAAVEGSEIKCWKEDVVLDYKIETVSFRLDGALEKSLMKIGQGAELARKLLTFFVGILISRLNVYEATLAKFFSKDAMLMIVRQGTVGYWQLYMMEKRQERR